MADMPAEETLTESSLEASLEGHALVLFDGVCNLCNSSVNFIIDRDRAGYFKFAALQDETVEPLLTPFDLSTETMDSIVLVEEGTCYRESTAALRIARRLNGGWPLFYALIIVHSRFYLAVIPLLMPFALARAWGLLAAGRVRQHPTGEHDSA